MTPDASNLVLVPPRLINELDDLQQNPYAEYCPRSAPKVKAKVVVVMGGMRRGVAGSCACRLRGVRGWLLLTVRGNWFCP